MPTEAGDNKLLGNFRKLIDLVSPEPNYSPSNLKLKSTNLEAQQGEGDYWTQGCTERTGITHSHSW